MKYMIYKLHFKTEVHIGNGALSDSEPVFSADTFFSALCHEAINIGGEETLEKLIKEVKSENMVFSDSFPFVKDSLYIPKPLLKLEKKSESDPSLKKEYKKLNYIDVNKLDDYLSGKLDIKAEKTKFSLGEKITRDRVNLYGEESLPYRVGTFNFYKGSGLYVCVGYTETNKDLIYKIVKSLSYTGIGGKISSGLGKFDLDVVDVPDTLMKRLEKQYKTYMTLSASMAKDEEVETALKNASYLVFKRSGFIYSPVQIKQLVKKKDFYAFKSGSCFENKFCGDIFDVSENLPHPVYRYAKPLFMGVV